MDELQPVWNFSKTAWITAWPFIVQYRSELIALLALVVSIMAARIAWRNARAAETQAKAATIQADAALDQSREAQNNSSLSRNAYEVQALEAARARIDQASPRVVVTLNLLSESPTVTEGWINEPPIPHPPIHSRGKLTLDYMKHRHDYIYFVLQGMLYNEGDRVARVQVGGLAEGPVFYADSHPVAGNKDVAVPYKSDVEHTYLLEPGQTALFEIRPVKSIWDLLDTAEDKHPYPLISRDFFRFRPGSLNEPELYVTITTRVDNPVRQSSTDDQWNTPIKIDDRCHVFVDVQRELHYPKNFDYVHAELQDDQDKLRQMQLMDQIIASYKERDGTE
ncbi:hypothetical protein AB0H12_36440 [Actinosynnema sp. NPDC023794]